MPDRFTCHLDDSRRVHVSEVGAPPAADFLHNRPCPKCGVRNFKRNTRCFQCQAVREHDSEETSSSGGGGGHADSSYGNNKTLASSSGGGGSSFNSSGAAVGASHSGSGGGVGSGANDADEQSAVETLANMLRKSGGEQVVSVLVQVNTEKY